MKNIIIKIPDNCELIKEDDTTFKVITEREPKTWKDFCDIVPVINEYYIDQFSNVHSISSVKEILCMIELYVQPEKKQKLL